MPDSTKRRRVLIVGAGAAGTAAAFSLGKSPDKFEVHVWEKAACPGGVATSVTLEGAGDLFINDGVQAGCPTYRNTLNVMSEVGFSGSPIQVKIAFGKGCTAWTNYTITDPIDKHRNEIKRFGRTLRIIYKLDFIFLFLPISMVLRMFGHSAAFLYEMVFPLTALFFGTGNQTPSVSAAMIARVFLDTNLKLFDYDPERLLSQTPEMFVFPKLGDMYQTIIDKTGCVFHASRTVTSVVRRKGKVYVIDDSHVMDVFDEIIFACDAETILSVLKAPTFIERKVLGNIQYYNDVTVTHTDDEYMDRHYELGTNVGHYFIRSDIADPSKLEMSFNLSSYQPQLKFSGRNIYQTIFLNDAEKHIWTINEIDPQKIVLTRWWRKFSHTWRHFALTVPLMKYIQGTHHTWYCGAYTLVGTHEAAFVSGFAAAYRIGAMYPFPEDDLARTQFEQYLILIHGKPVRYGCNMETMASILITPLMILFIGLAVFIQFIMRCLRKDV